MHAVDTVTIDRLPHEIVQELPDIGSCEVEPVARPSIRSFNRPIRMRVDDRRSVFVSDRTVDEPGVNLDAPVVRFLHEISQRVESGFDALMHPNAFSLEQSVSVGKSVDKDCVEMTHLGAADDIVDHVL
jgi:hypothetical protein